MQRCTEKKMEVQRDLDIHSIIGFTLLHHSAKETVQNQTIPYSVSRVTFKVSIAQCCPVECSVMMKMFWAIQYGSQQPHAANEHLKCGQYEPLWRRVCRFLKKLKIELPYDPAIPLLGIYCEKTIIQKESRTTTFIAALFTIARTWKQPKCPSTDEWIKKMWHIYTMEYYS